MSWKKLIDLVDRHAKLARKLDDIRAEWKKLGMPADLLENTARRSAVRIPLNTATPTRHRSPKVTTGATKKIEAMYKDGKSATYIAKVMKLSPGTVYRHLRTTKSVKAKQSKVPESTVSDKVMEVITSMATHGVVTRDTVRKESKRLFKFNAFQVGQGIATLERQKRVRPDGDTIHVS
jgi:hypothetical protein